MARQIIATQLIRGMTAGRTAPILCGCEDDQERPAGEYVVKLRGSLDRGNASLLLELVGSRLASHFGILVPEPAIVRIDADFAELFADHWPVKLTLARNSVGLNFGSKFIHPMAIWPVDKTIPGTMFQAAVDIFAFDALIKNPDRRYNNPNLFAQGDNFYVFDHETSFSFLLDILPRGAAWNLETETYLSDHVFFKRLKVKEIDLADFEEKMSSLTDQKLEQIGGEIPPEWLNEDWQRIQAHIREQCDHHVEFVEQVRRRLT